MSALAIFHCRPNSHPFQERHVSLHEPCKIGRSVARARPAPNNAIFDCKVLSRNHALLWYEDGTFYLQDTKSSNGTFVNNQRLSKGSEESPAREVYSGDIVQFGVDVMENSRRGQSALTHGCIIASISLFFPDGREAKPSHSNAFVNPPLSAGAALQSQELYQLAQYLQEALHREQMLESKLATLQRLVQDTQESSESGWQALIDEDRLLSRLEVLENQLQIYSKNQTEDTLRQELVALTEDKSNYETTAKESLKRVLQEKLEAVRKLSELERSLSNTEDECTHLRQMCENSQKELELLAEKHQQQLQDMADLQQQLQEAEKKHEEEIENVEKEKAELQAKIDDMVKEENILSAKVESLQADNDFTKEQLTNMKARMETIKEQSVTGETKILDLETQDVQADTISTDLDSDNVVIEDGGGHLKEKLRATQEEIEKYKAQLEESESRVLESKENVDKLQDEVEQARITICSQVAQIASLEVQLTESNKQKMNTDDLTRDLKDQITDLEQDLSEFRNHSGNELSTTLTHSSDLVNSNSIHEVANHIEETALVGSGTSNEIERLRELLAEARESQRKSEAELEKCRHDLEDAESRVKRAAEEAVVLKSQISQAEQQAKERSSHIIDLQEQLNKAETTTKEVKQQILTLRDRLIEEQEISRTNQEEAQRLRSESLMHTCVHLHTHTRVYEEQVHELHKQLQDAQQAAKQGHNEAEQLRMKVKSLHEELELEKMTNQSESGPSHENTHTEMQRQAARNRAEFTALKEECANLRLRIAVIEGDMKTTRKDNIKLSADYERLQESYKELEEMKENLMSKEMSWQINLTDAQKDASLTKEELTQANNELAALKDKCSQYSEEITLLKCQLDELTEEYRLVADKSRAVTLFSVLPLLMLLFALIVAFYRPLSEFTATSSSYS